MNKKEYADYEERVAAFFEREQIENLTPGYHECPDCEVAWDKEGKCPECGNDRECVEESYFSHSGCDCCGTHLGGNREHATGYCRKTKEIYSYQICSDCVYYCAYGRLDDMTMMEVEKDEPKKEQPEEEKSPIRKDLYAVKVYDGFLEAWVYVSIHKTIKSAMSEKKEYKRRGNDVRVVHPNQVVVESYLMENKLWE